MIEFAVFIYARLSSTRLPGKALMPVADKTLLETVIQNLSFLGDNIPVVLLTSDQKEDDKLENIARSANIQVFRGHLNNVALRTTDAIKYLQPEYFIRINGDCPVQLKELFEKGLNQVNGADLVSNIITRTYNYGLSFELIRSETFLEYQPLFTAEESEHITSYFYENQGNFDIHSIECLTDYYSNSPSLAVDDEESYRFVKSVLEQYPDIGSKNIHELNEQLKHLQ